MIEKSLFDLFKDIIMDDGILHTHENDIMGILPDNEPINLFTLAPTQESFEIDFNRNF